MILKNKLTKETLDIPYSEFRTRFVRMRLKVTAKHN